MTLSAPVDVQKFSTILSANRISTTAEDLETYGKDWLKRFPANPSVILFPETTAEVSAIVIVCETENYGMVPSGGRTGLSGGATAMYREVVISLSRMNKIGVPDILSQTIRVEAGAVTEAVHKCAEEVGLTWPVDFASKGSSQVGGNIATNAGGVRVIRYGNTRNWVLSLEVVTGGGQILELNRDLEKNNSGFDFRQLFIGSEGVLGLITAATLKLCPTPRNPIIGFFAVPDLGSLFQLFLKARQSGFALQAFECLDRASLEAVLKVRNLRDPLNETSPWYCLIEFENLEVEAFESWFADLFGQGTVTDGAFATAESERARLWTYREGISESLSAHGVLHKHDISLPVAKLGSFLEIFEKEFKVAYARFQTFIFGHVGDGNLHVNLLKPEALTLAEFEAELPVIDQWIFERIEQFGGSVSAEHGIGLLKKKALHYSKSAAEIALMKQVKLAFDPQGVFNPGKII